MGEQFSHTFLTARSGDDFLGFPFSLSKTAKSRSISRWFLSLSVDKVKIFKIEVLGRYIIHNEMIETEGVLIFL